MTISPKPNLAVPMKKSGATFGSIIRDSGGGSEPPASIPTISSVTGTVSQNEILTINGSFTANRNGQLGYYIGDNTAIGSEPTFLGAFGATNVSYNYKHANDFSFNQKTGASLKVSREEVDAEVSNAIINLSEQVDELYLSYEFRFIHGSDGTGTPQLKMGRLVSTAGDDFSPVLGPTMFFYAANEGSYSLVISNGVGTQGVPENPSSPGNRWTAPETDGEWRRMISYYRRKDAEGLASRLFKIIDHSTDQQVFRVVVTNEGVDHWDWITDVIHQSSADLPNTWVPPRVFDYDDSYSFSEVYLPYYTRDQKEDWWVDCVHVNDSLERVEVGNASTIGACGKLVQQFMSGRTTSVTDIEFEQGNLLTSEDWYLFVTNRDGTPSEGFLIRSAT